MTWWWPFKRKQAPEPESPPVDPQIVKLARQRPCLGGDLCQIATNEWCGLAIWQCPACQFETFHEDEAKRFVVGDQKHG